jgi:hypothetical protein
MPEDYVRPPIVAFEPPDPRLVKWRFRIIVLLLLAAVAVAMIFIARAIIHSGEGSPTAASPGVTVVAAG